MRVAGRPRGSLVELESLIVNRWNRQDSPHAARHMVLSNHVGSEDQLFPASVPFKLEED